MPETFAVFRHAEARCHAMRRTRRQRRTPESRPATPRLIDIIIEIFTMMFRAAITMIKRCHRAHAPYHQCLQCRAFSIIILRLRAYAHACTPR